MSEFEFLSFLLPLLGVGITLGVLFDSGIKDLRQDIREARNKMDKVQERAVNVEIELGGRMAWVEGLLAARSEASSAKSMYRFRMTEKD